MYVCASMCVRQHVYVRVCVRVLHVCVQLFVFCVYMCICVYVYICVYMHVLALMCTRTCVQSVSVQWEWQVPHKMQLPNIIHTCASVMCALLCVHLPVCRTRARKRKGSSRGSRQTSAGRRGRRETGGRCSAHAGQRFALYVRLLIQAAYL